MFFDNYLALCEEHGEKPYNLPLKLGAKNNSMVAQWKKGSVPRLSMLEKIADYFNVSVGYLMDGEQKEEPAAQEGSELSVEQLEAIEKIKSLSPEELARKMTALRAVLDMK